MHARGQRERGRHAFLGSRYSEHRYLSRDDAEGLVSLYGRLDATLDYHYSDDGGLTWSDGALLGAQATLAAPGSVSEATEGEGEVWMGHHAASSWVGRVQAMTSFSAPSAVAVGSLSTFHAAAAALGDGTVVSARWVDATRTNNSKTLRWAWSTDSGATWDGADALRNDADTVQSRRNGLGVAYDPKTGRFALTNGFRMLGDLGLVFNGPAEKLVAVYARE